MARPDLTGRSRARRHRWHVVFNARSRLCVVRSGSGDSGRESSYRPLQATLSDAGIAGLAGLTIEWSKMITLVPQCEPEPPSKPVKSNCPDCDAELAVLRITPGKSGAEYWTMRC